MRDRAILLESFDEIRILQQFLYMDADNSVSMKNKLGVVVQIRLTDDLQYLGKNLQFPNVPEMNFDGEMNLKVFRELIQQLKSQPAISNTSRFKSRWEEICEITLANLALNKNK